MSDQPHQPNPPASEISPETKPLPQEIREVLRRLQSERSSAWWLDVEINKAAEEEGFYIVPHHFYSPLPTPADISATSFFSQKYDLSRLGVTADSCLPAMTSIAACWPQFVDFLHSGTGFSLQNPFYGNMDALSLFATVFLQKPRRIVEVGSGYSTHVSYGAGQISGVAPEITCIEPFPSPKLQELRNEVNILPTRVQEVDSQAFQDLRENDILFIDSSHCSRLDSDVHDIFFRLLPNLSKGVIVHFHDIFLPFEYPQVWVEERRWFWNEQYVLYAYLLADGGNRFDIMFPTCFACHSLRASFEPRLLGVDGFLMQGGSFWLRVK